MTTPATPFSVTTLAALLAALWAGLDPFPPLGSGLTETRLCGLQNSQERHVP